MAKTIHIHLPPGMVVTRTTRDSGDWKESDHPRAKNGQFGSGGGGAKPAAKKDTSKAPETGFAEREKANAEKMPKGSKVQFGSGKPAGEVIRHAGNMVLTTQGEYHVSKLMPAGGPKPPTAPSGNAPLSVEKLPGRVKETAAKLGPLREQVNKLKTSNDPAYYEAVSALTHHTQALYHLEEAQEFARSRGGMEQAKEAVALADKHSALASQAEARLGASANVPGQGAAPSSPKPQAPASSSGAPNWSAINGNWDKAKKEGRELVQAKLQEAKTGGDRTDALLALKKQAEVEHKKGSYLAAVVIGEVNDYFDRVK